MPKVALLKDQYKLNEIGRYIEAQRTLRGMKQVELAELSGMSQQNYSWKVKNNSFSYLDLIRLFDALKLPDEEILGRMKL